MNGAGKLSIATHFLRVCWRWQHLRGQALERYQETRAQRIVAYIFQHSPFYRATGLGMISSSGGHYPL